MLDDIQVKRIEADVERARITLSHLSDELIDHICCEVEYLMSMHEKSFEEAYLLVKQQTGIEVLQRIQENTLYLIDKKYARMKTTMKITGNVSLVLLGMGTVMKIFHWPGAGPVLLLGFILLCLIFFPSAIYLNYKEFKTKSRPLLSLSALLGGVIFMLGILFKVMHWPGNAILLLTGWSLIIWIFLPILLIVKLKEANNTGEKRTYVTGVIALMVFELSTMFKLFHWPGAGPLMIMGSVLLVSFFLPMYTSMRFRETGKISGQFIFLVTISMYAIVLSVLLALNVSQDILACFVNDESNSAKITDYFEKKIKRQTSAGVSDSSKAGTGTKISELTLQAEKVHKLIQDIKLNLIQRAEKVDQPTALALISHPDLIKGKDNYTVVNTTLLGMEGKAPVLKKELDLFREKVRSAIPGNAGLSVSLAKLLDMSIEFPVMEINTWEEENFRNNTLISTLSFLSGMEKNISLVESVSIEYQDQKN